MVAWIALVLLAWPAVPAWAADWKRLDTPNFVVIGNIGAGDLADVARQFEGFRETLGRLLGQRATGSAVPTIVFVFANDRDFAPYKLLFKGKPIEIAGMFMPGPDLNQIAMVQFPDESATRVIFHEYMHEVVSNVFRRAPVWFGEGLAEYYSSFELRNDGRRALIGKPVPAHIGRLREGALLPIETLIAVGHDSPLYNESDHRSVFYAESWALVHFLLNDPSRRAQLTTYLGMLAQGSPPVEAWRKVFGPGIEAALGQYLQQFAFSYTQFDFPQKIVSVDSRPVVMKEADVRVALAGLLIHQRRFDESAECLSAAARLDPSNAWADVRMAQIELASGNRPAAEKRMAGSAQPVDWLAAYEAGIVRTRLVDRPGVQISQAEVAGIRRVFERVQQQRGEIPNVLARSAALVLWTSEVPPLEAIEEIQRARELAPGREEYAFLQAQLLARRGSFAEARNILGPYVSSAVAPNVRNRARSLMTYVEIGRAHV
jgi:tetratricopeptide (TPR) repeat protein